MIYFTIKEEHLLLLKNSYVDWSDFCYGAPSIDPKRPYGNSSVECDIVEILGWEIDPKNGPTKEQRRLAKELHYETKEALQICLHTQKFETGTYSKEREYSGEWKKEE